MLKSPRHSQAVFLTAAALSAALALSPATTAAEAPLPLGQPATVTVRVEGQTETLLQPTQVTTTTTPVVKDANQAHACAGTSAAGALQLASAGNWNGQWFSGLGYSVETIAGVSYPFTQPYFWTLWLDNKPATTGICGVELNPGDSVLFFPECFSETKGVCPPPPNPLGIEVPANDEVGVPVTITVTSYAAANGAPAPAVGASVENVGEHISATTDAGGHAALGFPHAGSFTVSATAAGSIRTEATVCVHNGNDGTCATKLPAKPSAAPAPPPSTVVPYTGPYAVVAKAVGVLDDHVYGPGHAPRVLAGTVLAHAAVSSVSIELRRRNRARCSAYSGARERFVRARCGQGSFFQVSRTPTFSYLLPSALAPGRYVLDIQATDALGNRTTLARGTSRIVFYVR